MCCFCLQEVETEQFYNFFLPELQRDGYSGIFSPKSRAKTMSDAEKLRVDGCAIFYRNSKYVIVIVVCVIFFSLADCQVLLCFNKSLFSAPDARCMRIIDQKKVI